ncbi:glycosyltransferase [Lyngbya confervoides]|uniref:Glycosyltransferase n=1 Tax=Lyngbya confervoides BDU141951 TaxID=1574623 RepID=A0ABD4SZL2_9CYAN|nr:glycosyltransferase [Lyngbya confervoides]MCM1981596.1 glycosyltransferase [Lyngbya confervoides BDU141951]
MKVLHVIPSISPLRGGPTQAVLEMVQTLRQRGIEAEIATTNDHGNDTLSLPLRQRYDYPLPSGDPVPVYCFPRHESPVAALREFTLSASLTRFLLEQGRGYDLIHSHAIFSYPSVAAMAIARLLHIPYIVRPLGSLCAWSLTQRAGRKQHYLKLIKPLLNHSHGLHFTAEQERQEARSLGIRAPEWVIPLGLKVAPPQAEAREQLRASLGLPPQQPVLLFLSRIHPKKGLEPLIQALGTLRGQPCTLVIAGSGEAEYEAQIQSLVAAQGLTAQVRSVGFVSGAQKQQLLQGSDVFVLTSHSENFGIVVLEALAAGTPVLVTPGVALADLVQRHDLGWVCPMQVPAIAAALQAAIGSPALRRQKGDRARQVVQDHYSWQSVAEQLERHYHLATSSPSNPIPSMA